MSAFVRVCVVSVESPCVCVCVYGLHVGLMQDICNTQMVMTVMIYRKVCKGSALSDCFELYSVSILQLSG